MTWSENLLNFYKTLQQPKNLPADIEWLYPQQSEAVMQLVKQFLFKYFNDEKVRRLIFGINPGRYGAGVTGVNFTAPKQLAEACGIMHHLKMHSELSADFIYAMIDAYGGAEKFYGDYFIGSVCTLGFVKNGRNINYYDDKELLKTVEPFIIETIEKQVSFSVDKNLCICLGGEKNFKYLSELNERYGWFKKIESLPHPRFIMQYRRKKVNDYIKLYLTSLKK